MPIKSSCGALLFVFSTVFCFDASAQFTQQQGEGYRRSVVRVDATGCAGVPGGAQMGTGFFWKQDTWVVTALHVVNGCTGLSVYSDIIKDSASAHASKVLVADDLVLLTLDKTIKGSASVTKAEDAPKNTEDLLVVGFPGDSSGSTAKTVRRQLSGDKLETIVSYEARQELLRSQSPALDITVIFLQGILEHGHSGSPIFNHDGNVVGIADGGLKHGTTEDSWAIPSNNLAALENSSEPLAKMTAQKSTLLFAATPISNMEPALQCGGGNFKHLKTVRYSDVLLTTDDARGLQQLVTAAFVDPSSFAFEVYQDLQTGASVVLPEGEKLSASGDTCIAVSRGAGVTTRVRVGDASADLTGNTASLQFETQVMGLSPGWMLAQAFSYLQPLPVAGGGVSFRKDWVHYPPLPGTLQLNFQAFDGQQFETLALRGTTLLGVVAQNARWNPMVVQTQTACRQNKNASPYCAQALQDFDDWIKSTLAVHLSTMAGT